MAKGAAGKAAQDPGSEEGLAQRTRKERVAARPSIRMAADIHIGLQMQKMGKAWAAMKTIPVRKTFPLSTVLGAPVPNVN